MLIRTYEMINICEIFPLNDMQTQSEKKYSKWINRRNSNKCLKSRKNGLK